MVRILTKEYQVRFTKKEKEKRNDRDLRLCFARSIFQYTILLTQHGYFDGDEK